MWLKLILPFWRTCTPGWFVTHWLLCMKQKKGWNKNRCADWCEEKKPCFLLYCRSLHCSCVWLLLKKCYDKSPPLVHKELQENSWTFETNDSTTRTNSDNATSLCSHCGNTSKTTNLLYSRFLFFIVQDGRASLFLKGKKSQVLGSKNDSLIIQYNTTSCSFEIEHTHYHDWKPVDNMSAFVIHKPGVKWKTCFIKLNSRMRI